MTYFVDSRYNQLLISLSSACSASCRTTTMWKVLSPSIDNPLAQEVIVNYPLGDDETLAVPWSRQRRRIVSACFDRGRGVLAGSRSCQPQSTVLTL